MRINEITEIYKLNRRISRSIADLINFIIKYNLSSDDRLTDIAALLIDIEMKLKEIRYED